MDYPQFAVFFEVVYPQKLPEVLDDPPADIKPKFSFVMVVSDLSRFRFSAQLHCGHADALAGSSRLARRLDEPMAEWISIA